MQTESIANKIISDPTTAVGAPTIAIDYASIEAAIVAARIAGTSGECAVQVVDINLKAGQLRPYRQILEGYIEDAGDFSESVYLVLPGFESGSVCVHKIFDATWTAGSEPATNTGVDDHDYASSVVVTSTGVLEAITGIEARPVDADGAMIVIEDCGPAIGLLRAGYLPGSGAATSGVLGTISWR